LLWSPLAAGQGLSEEAGSMTLSAFLSSVLTGNADDIHATAGLSADQQDIQRYKAYRRFFPMMQVALPAMALNSQGAAKWARDHRVAIDVHTGEELAVAIAAGVQLARMTVFADALSQSELRAVAKLGVGRVVAGSVREVEVLRSVVCQQAQGVVIGMTSGNHQPRGGFRFDSNEADAAVAAVIDHEWLNLIGLHCEVGPMERDFVSYPAAIGHMIGEMSQIRRNHGDLLTRLGLGGGRTVPSGDWTVELPRLATQIDVALDDACAALRFPRPSVVLSAGPEILERSAT
jgi:diaminopimelate decarboxylase